MIEIILIIVAVVLLWLWYMGLFYKVQIEESQFGPVQILYREYQGNYPSIKPSFDKFAKIVSQSFKSQQYCGIYYDPPMEVENKNQCRAIIGLIIESQEKGLIDAFLKQNQYYKIATLPTVKALKSIFPYRNSWSLVFMSPKVQPKVSAYVKKKNQPDSLISCTIELYPIKTQPSPQTIQLFFPYGKDAIKYDLSSIPAPKYRFASTIMKRKQ